MPWRPPPLPEINSSGLTFLLSGAIVERASRERRNAMAEQRGLPPRLPCLPFRPPALRYSIQRRSEPSTMARLMISLAFACLAVRSASGLRSRGEPDVREVLTQAKQAVEYFDPFAIASATTMVRLGKEAGGDAPKVWGGDRAKTVAVGGLSNGQFKAGGVVSAGVGAKKAHAEGAVGYSGAEAPGVADHSWQMGGAELTPQQLALYGAMPAKDGGVDYGKIEGKFSAGHAAAEDLRAKRP
mmetsp:Transcript_125684/g.391390  ORF Transcript_125684/g.391390 Transcript_125684/m.391390 type:complete len:241 (-) Transcript_125684:41-763(-)